MPVIILSDILPVTPDHAIFRKGNQDPAGELTIFMEISAQGYQYVFVKITVIGGIPVYGMNGWDVQRSKPAAQTGFFPFSPIISDISEEE